MVATKKLRRFVQKVLSKSRQNLQGSSLSAGSSSCSLDSASLASSRQSWGSLPDAHYDSEDECSSPLPDVPAGCLPVYVGNERRRFVIHTSYLKHNVFRELLAKSEEEFGFKCEGGLRVACKPEVFEHLLWWLECATAQCAEEAEVDPFKMLRTSTLLSKLQKLLEIAVLLERVLEIPVLLEALSSPPA